MRVWLFTLYGPKYLPGVIVGQIPDEAPSGYGSVNVIALMSAGGFRRLPRLDLPALRLLPNGSFGQ